MGHTQNKSNVRVGQVLVEFTNKPVSAWSGMAALIGKLLEQIEFRSWVDSALPVEEVSNHGYGAYTKILAHLLTVFSGGERFEHMTWWRHGVKVFEKAFGVECFAKSSTSLTRFWNKFDSQGKSERWAERVRDFTRQLLGWAGARSGNLNLDSTVLTRYGKQQGARKGYNPKKKGRPSHHPLLAFVDSGYVVNLWNRSGNASSGEQAPAFFRTNRPGAGRRFRD